MPYPCHFYACVCPILTKLNEFCLERVNKKTLKRRLLDTLLNLILNEIGQIQPSFGTLPDFTHK